MSFQPPSRGGGVAGVSSSRMLGEVRVTVTVILGSASDVRMMEQSSMELFTSYFSGVTSCQSTKSNQQLAHRKEVCDAMQSGLCVSANTTDGG